MRRAFRCLLALWLGLVCWAAGSNEFRFAILGDRTGRARPPIYAQTWSEIDRFRPAFVINVGDTIQGTDDERAEGQWKEIHQFLEKYRRFPFYFVPGNHDIWGTYSKTVFARETGRAAPYSFNYQNAHFVVLDNSRSLDLPLDQLQFLEEDLKESRSRTPKFVFFHQPFWLFFVKLKSGAFPLHRLAREYGVEYVVSGHGHQFIRLLQDGVTYMEVGSSGADIGDVWNQDGAFAKGAFYHYVQVHVKGPQAEITVKELGPPFGRGRGFSAGDWGEDGLKPAAQAPGLRSPTPSR